MKLPTFKIVE